MNQSPADPSRSPCKLICQLIDNKCVGCLRTIKEIAQWRRMSDDERQAIINDLKNRS